MPDADPHEHRFHADSVSRSIEVLGDRWTFLILRETFFGVRRFGELASNLGCSRQLLSQRLTRLVDHGVLERRRYRESPERFEYRLTDAGRDLYDIVLAFMGWGDRHLAGPEGVPLVLRHRACGKDTRPVMCCSACGERIDPREVDARPGPGSSATLSR